MTQIVIMAKEPLPGRVKTRLIPAYGAAGAASLALAALQDTLAAATASAADRVVLALDGEPGTWLPYGLTVLGQRAGGFGARLAGAMADAYEGLGVPVLVIGMDTPQVSPALLDVALGWLSRPGRDAVLGRAYDGGYWCLGLRTPDARVFDGVPMSTSTTGLAQLTRLTTLGLRTVLVPRLRDVDEPADVAEVAAMIPGSRFAGVAADLDRVLA